jgi:hypothetical protein
VTFQATWPRSHAQPEAPTAVRRGFQWMPSTGALLTTALGCLPASIPTLCGSKSARWMPAYRSAWTASPVGGG